MQGREKRHPSANGTTRVGYGQREGSRHPHYDPRLLDRRLSIVLVPGSAAAQEIRGGVQGGVSFTSLANLGNAIDFGGPIDVKRRTGLAIGPRSKTR
jgi:hypothetical protein